MTALKAFEAAARHRSFSRAADELCVSQAAISHQIKLLEAYLGGELFVRTSRNSEPTGMAELLLPSITRAFDEIDRATRHVIANGGSKSLYVRVPPFLSRQWVVPRLANFTLKNPDIELNLQHFYHLPDFHIGKVDIAVFWGEGELPNLVVERLLPAPYTMVCSPELLRGGKGIKKLADINDHQIMHITDYSLWERWARAAGAPIDNVRRGLITDNQNTLVEAIVSGQGVGLALEYLVSDYLASGKLARPFDLTFDLGYAYRLVYLPEALKVPNIRRFRDWIVGEAALFKNQTLDGMARH